MVAAPLVIAASGGVADDVTGGDVAVGIGLNLLLLAGLAAAYLNVMGTTAGVHAAGAAMTVVLVAGYGASVASDDGQAGLAAIGSIAVSAVILAAARLSEARFTRR